jgi:hypothetical protein
VVVADSIQSENRKKKNMYAHLAMSNCARTVFQRRFFSSRLLSQLLLSRESISASDLINPQQFSRADAPSPQAGYAPVGVKVSLDAVKQGVSVISNETDNSGLTSTYLSDLLSWLTPVLSGLETAVAATARLGPAHGALYASSSRLKQRAEKLKATLRVIKVARRSEASRGLGAELLDAAGDNFPANVSIAPALAPLASILLPRELEGISDSFTPLAPTRPSLSAVSGYRDSSSYSLLHHRLLEAAEARDLGSVLELLVAGSNDHNPDLLAVEIAFDACARAGRADLAFGFVWPRLVSARVEISPALRLLLLKAASLAGQLDLTTDLLQPFRDGADSPELKPLAFLAAISCAVACDKFDIAVEIFNDMRQQGVQSSSAIFATLFMGADKSRDSQSNCKLVWSAIQRSPSVSISPTHYELIVTEFASQGNLEDMGAAWRRMGRKIDGALVPTSSALLAMLRAFAGAGDSTGASSVVAALEPHLASGKVSRSRVDEFLGAVREASALRGSRVKPTVARFAGRHRVAIEEDSFVDVMKLS